jgi:hypothetical protein
MAIEDKTDQETQSMQFWHVGKEIPLALIAAVVVQTGGFIWSLSSLSNKVDNLVETIREIKLERYTKDDGRRDRELLMQMLEVQRQRAGEHERRLSSLEASQEVGRNRSR